MRRFTKEDIPVFLIVSFVTIFSVWFWAAQIWLNSSEPLEVSVLYRYHDFGYFGVIERIFNNFFGEFQFWDSRGETLAKLPISGLLLHAILFKVFNGWGFVFADVIFNLIRLWAFYLLARIFFENRWSVALCSLALWLLTSEYNLGDFGHHTIFQGVWSFRIPRPMITSIFLLLSILSLVKLEETLSPALLNRRSVFKILFVSLTLVLLANGDPYSAAAVGLVTFGLILYYFNQQKINNNALMVFVVGTTLLLIPMLLQNQGSSPEIMERLGAYKIVYDLLTIEVPSRIHLGFVFLSLGLLIFIGRLIKNEKVLLRFGIILNSLAITSIVVSPLFAVIMGFNIQEYQFAIRARQFSGLLMVFWLVLLIKIVSYYAKAIKVKEFRAQIILLFLVCLYGAQINIDEHGLFVMKQAEQKNEAEPGFLGPYHQDWRASATEVYEFLKKETEKSELVVASFDLQLMTVLSPINRVWFYLSYVFNTDASNEELESRFLNFCSLLGLSNEMLVKLLTNRAIHTLYLSGGKFQFNRIHNYFSLEKYPPQALAVLPKIRDNWGLLVPDAEIYRAIKRYSEQVLNPQENLKALAKYRVPDILVVNRAEGFESLDPKGYLAVFKNKNFILFRKN